MKSINLILKYFISILISFNCNCSSQSMEHEKELYKPIIVRDSLIYEKGVVQSILARINYFDFKGNLIRFKNDTWYPFLREDKREILLINLQNPSVIDSISIETSDSLRGKKIILSKDNIVYIYRPKSNFLSELNLQNGKTRKFNLPKLDDSKYYYKEIGFYEVIDSDSPKVIFNYGSLQNEKAGYLDKNHNFIVLDPSKENFQKIGFYPNRFFRKKKYYAGTIFDIDTRGSIYFTYELNDSIFKINQQGKVLGRNKLHNTPNFIDFDWNKEQNLAYMRKYSSNTEMNLYLKVISGDRILVIKQLSNINLLHPPKYKYFLLDLNLNIINADTIRHKVYPRLAYEYKKGFILLSDSLNKAYYYEIH